jgi:siroheme synthase (precorrin-2 oxidase/ferrochelatase)
MNKQINRFCIPADQCIYINFVMKLLKKNRKEKNPNRRFWQEILEKDKINQKNRIKNQKQAKNPNSGKNL